MSLINFNEFISHSGIHLPWKIDCDFLKDEDIESLAKIIHSKFIFRDAYGIPTGGQRLAKALKKYIDSSSYYTLLVDDVLTTGKSMEDTKQVMYKDTPLIGVVIFSRGKCPSWIWPIFSVSK